MPGTGRTSVRGPACRLASVDAPTAFPAEAGRDFRSRCPKGEYVHAVKWVALLVVPALALVGITVGVAQAAVSGTVNPAAVSGSDFSWTCDVNPDGTTIYVAGRSWYNPNRQDAPAVDTPRKQISGSSTQRLAFSRDGEPNTSYGYRCV